MLGRIKRRIDMERLAFLERRYRALQPAYLSRVHQVNEIPDPKTRWANGYGTITYSEWCFTLGLFQGLFHRLRPTDNLRMLDVGCGIGRLYLAMKPLMHEHDRYTGLDVMPDAIDVCQRQYGADGRASFVHLPVHNATYAAGASSARKAWPFEDATFNFASGLSVWTHFSEQDFFFYLKELGRVLEPGSKAAITFFIMDDLYDQTLALRRNKVSAYYPQPESQWIYDVPAYGSTEFFTIRAAKVPEDAIGVRKSAFDRAAEESGLTVVEYMTGYWKERPGFWFQDLVVFERQH